MRCWASARRLELVRSSVRATRARQRSDTARQRPGGSAAVPDRIDDILRCCGICDKAATRRSAHMSRLFRRKLRGCLPHRHSSAVARHVRVAECLLVRGMSASSSKDALLCAPCSWAATAQWCICCSPPPPLPLHALQTAVTMRELHLIASDTQFCALALPPQAPRRRAPALASPFAALHTCVVLLYAASAAAASWLSAWAQVPAAWPPCTPERWLQTSARCPRAAAWAPGGTGWVGEGRSGELRVTGAGATRLCRLLRDRGDDLEVITLHMANCHAALLNCQLPAAKLPTATDLWLDPHAVQVGAVRCRWAGKI